MRGHARCSTEDGLVALPRRERSNPDCAIDVTASDGYVGLAGHVLAAEHTPLVQTISAISGVAEIDDQLVVHDRPGNIPELQGGGVHGHL